MNKDEKNKVRGEFLALIEQENSRRQAEKIAALIQQKPELVELLMEFSLGDDAHVSMRASYASEFVFQKQPELIYPYVEAISKKVLQLPHSGSQRNLLKIVARCPLPEENLGFLLQACFDLVEALATPPAVKVWSLEILYRIGLQLPEINGELRLILEALYESGSAGERVRSRDLLKKMDQNP